MKPKIPFVLHDVLLTGSPDFPDITTQSGGSISADGTITLEKPWNLPTYLVEVYYPLPANALRDGSEQGWYRVEILTPTTGKVCEKYED